MKSILAIFLVEILAIAHPTDPWSEVVETFRWSPKSEESFQWEFSIIGKRVTWHEAKSLCTSKCPKKSRSFRNGTEKYEKSIGGSELAILDKEDLRSWFSRMLSESNYRYDDLWIGAFRKDSGSNWTWIDSQMREDVGKNISLLTGLGKFPYWKKKISELMTKSSKNCLTFNRMGHNLPGLVPTACETKKPFVCSKIVKKTSRTIKEGVNVTVDGFRYTIFSVDEGDKKYTDPSLGVQRLNGGGVKWIEARVECRKRGQYLAIVTSNEAVKKIGLSMMKNRPSMESVWLGGWSTDGLEWKWTSTNYALPSKQSSISQYPPWLAGHPIDRVKLDGNYYKYGRCLILDRHLCPDYMSPVFLDLDCTKKRPFVCQDKIPPGSCAGKNMTESPNRTFVINNQVFEFSQKPMTWSQGRAYCKNNNGKIANVVQSEVLSVILDGMSDLNLDHIWIGGRTTKTEEGWRWVDEDGKMFSRDEIGTKTAWCLGSESTLLKAEPENCLNLDREGHSLPLLYGLPCDSIKQHVLCLRNDTKKNTTEDPKSNISENRRNEISDSKSPVMNVTSRPTKKRKSNKKYKVSDLDEKTKNLLEAKGYNMSDSNLILNLEFEVVNLDENNSTIPHNDTELNL